MRKIAIIFCGFLVLSVMSGCKPVPTTFTSSESPSPTTSESQISTGSNSSDEITTIKVAASDPVAIVFFGYGGDRTAGVINLDGKFSVAPGKYSAITQFENNKAFAVTIGYGNDRIYDVIDKNGNVLSTFSQDKLGNVNDWLYEYMGSYSEGAITFGDGYKFGIINTNGDIILPMEYEEILPFSEGLAGVMKDMVWQFVNPEGEVVIDLGEFSGCESFHEGLAFFFTQDSSGYMDSSGTPVFINRSAEQGSGFSDYRGDFAGGVAPADVNIFIDEYTSLSGFGILSETGGIIFSDTGTDPDTSIKAFDRGGKFVDGLYPVSTSTALEFTGYGFVDQAGFMVVPIQNEWRPVGYRIAHEYYYENLNSNIGFYNDLCAAKWFSGENEKIGFIDILGNMAIPFNYDSVGQFAYGLAAVGVQEGDYIWEYINVQGETVIESEFYFDGADQKMTYASDFHK